MCGSVLFDQLHVSLLLPPGADAATADAIRAAFENARIPEAVAEAVRSLLSDVPALTVLTVHVES